MAEVSVETGISFTAQGSGGERWHKHAVMIDLDYLRSRLEGPALERLSALPVTRQILAVRCVTEIMVCVFRETRRDPSFDPAEREKWRQAFVQLVGEEGSGGIGV